MDTVATNIKALRDRAPESPALERYAEVASVFQSGPPDLDSVAPALRSLRHDLGILPLSEYGLKPEDVAPLVRDSRGSSMKYNPIVLTDAEIEGIITASMR